MTTSTPRDALIHEMVEALRTDAADRFDGVTLRKGFPNDLQLALPCISIDLPAEERIKARRRVYRQDEIDEDTVAVIFERERCELSGTIELWTKDKTEREPIELALDNILCGDELAPGGYVDPKPPGWSLVLSLLHNAAVRVRLMDRSVQDASGATSGYFRVMYSIEASVPDLLRVEYNKAVWSNTVSEI